MRTLVVACFTPFAESEHRRVALRLVEELRAHGFRTDLTLLPIDAKATLPHEQQLAYRLLDVIADSERLICVGLTAGFMRHRDKRIWVIEDDAADDTACLAVLREATKVFAAPGTGESLASRTRVRHTLLPVPGETDAWSDVVAALAT